MFPETLLIIPLTLVIIAQWLSHRRNQKNFEAFSDGLAVDKSRLIRQLYRQFDALEEELKNKYEGKTTQLLIATKITEKIADRAMSTANSAQVGISVLQRNLPSRRTYPTKHEAQSTKVTLAEMMKSDPEAVEMMLPTLTEEDRDLLDIANRFHENGKANGVVK